MSGEAAVVNGKTKYIFIQSLRSDLTPRIAKNILTSLCAGKKRKTKIANNASIKCELQNGAIESDHYSECAKSRTVLNVGHFLKIFLFSFFKAVFLLKIYQC